jgi:glycosyltransferase 2 family protein
MPGRSKTALQKPRVRIGWNSIGAVIGMAVFVVAVITLVRMLRNADAAKIAAAILATPVRDAISAGICVAAAYVTLTFYDWFALRTIGRGDVPYRVAALSAFTSYAIGHNIGATVFTANFIRYRMYAAYALTARDITKMAFVTGLTFWLGNVFVLGIGISYRPEAASAIDQLPAWLNRTIAEAMLLAIAAYVMWIAQKPRTIGRNGWCITLPNVRLTLVQIGIGVLDLGFSGLAMYALLPAEAATDFVGVLVSFIAAVLLGFVSHAPGGLGVFDAAMLLALPKTETEKLVAALVLFRLMYYLVPFTLALTALGVRELRFYLRFRSLGTRAKRDPNQ